MKKMNDINCNSFHCEHNVGGKCQEKIVFIDDNYRCTSSDICKKE